MRVLGPCCTILKSLSRFGIPCPKPCLDFNTILTITQLTAAFCAVMHTKLDLKLGFPQLFPVMECTALIQQLHVVYTTTVTYSMKSSPSLLSGISNLFFPKPIAANLICSEISGFLFWTDYRIETSNMHYFHWPKGLVWVVQGVYMLKISSAMMGQGWDGTKYVGHNQCKTGPRRDTSRETLLITYSHMHKHESMW